MSKMNPEEKIHYKKHVFKETERTAREIEGTKKKIRETQAVMK